MERVNKLEFYKKRKFLDKFSATFQFIQENALPFLKMHLFVSAPVLIIISILMNQVSGGLFALISDAQNLSANDFIDLAGAYGLSVMSVLVTTALIPAITYGYMQHYQTLKPKEITLSKVMEGFTSRFLNIFGYYILVTIGVTILGFVAGFVSSLAANVVGLWVFIVLIILGFAIVVLSVVLFLGVPAIAFEKGNPIDAFDRVFSLARGKWFSTFGLVICIGIIGLIISMLFAMPRGVYVGFEAFTNLKAQGDVSIMDEALTNTPLSVLFSVLESFGTIIMYSLVYVALGFQYSNLVERRESKGLVSRIEGIGEEDENDSDESY